MDENKKQRRLLVVDDNSIDRKAIDRHNRTKKLLYDIDFASSFSEGLQKATTGDYDVILLDHNLGDGYGLDILKEVKHIPVIFLTGSGDESVAAQSVRLGAYDYIVKDPDRGYLNVLPITIENVVKRKEEAIALVEAKNKAERATNLKDKFISLVAHDLRSPLSGMLGMLNLLQVECVNSDLEKHLHVIDRLMTTSSGMISMIDELLNITRLQTGKIIPVLKYIDGFSLVNSASLDLMFMASEKEIQIRNEISKECRLYADKELLAEVIQNLLSNAIKFSDAGDIIRIYISKGEPLCMVIEDCGAGIEPDLLPDLFLHEVKTTSKGTRGETGTGLGLPYCADILKAHGGALKMESTVGEGSRFYVCLPLVDGVSLVEHNAPE